MLLPAGSGTGLLIVILLFVSVLAVCALAPVPMDAVNPCKDFGEVALKAMSEAKDR